MKSPALSQIIPEDQQNCLKHLSNFVVDDCEDIKNGYKFIFTFETNPYFENETLIKEWGNIFNYMWTAHFFFGFFLWH